MSRSRILKVNQLIKKEFSRILFEKGNIPSESLATVIRVETLPNLSEAKVFISVIPDKNAPEVIAKLNKKIYYLQQALNKKLKMRPVPKIVLKEEKGIRKAARIEELFEELKKEKK